MMRPTGSGGTHPRATDGGSPRTAVSPSPDASLRLTALLHVLDQSRGTASRCIQLRCLPFHDWYENRSPVRQTRGTDVGGGDQAAQRVPATP